MFGVVEGVNPSNPLDWGLLAVVALSVVTSVGHGVKRIIEWVVAKITAPDTRMHELEEEKAQRDAEDRARFVKLEAIVERLQKELIDVHIELKLSEVARARTEGELAALRQQVEMNTVNRELQESTKDET
jgi:hypothetical protein